MQSEASLRPLLLLLPTPALSTHSHLLACYSCEWDPAGHPLWCLPSFTEQKFIPFYGRLTLDCMGMHFIDPCIG